MKFTIDAETFFGAMQRAKGIAETNTTLMVLSNTLIEAKGDTLTFHATDLNSTISIENTNCEIQEEGRAVLEVEKLYKIAQKLDDQELVEVRVEDNKWGHIEAGSLSCRIRGMETDKFPKVPDVSPDNMLKVDASALASLIDKTAFAASDEDAHQNLCGINMKVKDDCLDLSSTDGHRMSTASYKAEDLDYLQTSDERLYRDGITVPTKTLEELKRTLESHDGAARFGFSEERVVFEVGKKNKVRMSSSLVAGAFPDFDSVLPEFDKSRSAIALRENLLSAIDIISIFTSRTAKKINLSLEDSGDLRVSAVDADAGAGEEIVAVAFDADAIDTNYNYTYLDDALQAIEGDEVEIMCSKGNEPTLIQDPDDRSAMFVVMPLR